VSPTRVRRSLLIAPAHKERLIMKLATSAADVCILELEDGVHQSLKSAARESAARLLGELDWGGRERIVRINRVATADGEQDIAVLAAATPDGLLLPKVDGEEEIRRASELLSAAERRAGIPVGKVRLWAMIETAQGLGRVEAIASADPRVTAVLFGAGDFGASIGVKRLGLGAFRRFPAPSHEYLYARGRVVAAARAAGIDPIDVGYSTFGDLEGTLCAAEISAQMGFAGSVVFHPNQVPAVNEAFTPPPSDVAWAQEVIDRTRDEAAKEEAGTVVVVDGDMIDGPFVTNAQAILDRREQIQALEARKLSTKRRAMAEEHGGPPNGASADPAARV
jgi:citrate lyase beta subunit